MDGQAITLSFWFTTPSKEGSFTDFPTYLPCILVPDQKVQFTGFCWAFGSTCVCTHNSIVCYQDWPPKEPARVICNSYMNDLHHCFPSDGQLAVANTGLETVDVISESGELIRRYDMLEASERRFPICHETDYRKLNDTKPHLLHLNHLFLLDGELWVTRLRTSDAVCTTDVSKRSKWVSVCLTMETCLVGRFTSRPLMAI